MEKKIIDKTRTAKLRVRATSCELKDRVRCSGENTNGENELMPKCMNH